MVRRKVPDGWDGMTPTELVQLINTGTPGAITRNVMANQRDHYGARITNPDGTIRVVDFAAEVAATWARRTAERVDILERQLRKKIASRRAARDIGEIPDIQDKRLRRRCDRTLRTFLEAMFPDRFFLKWSQKHLELIRELEYRIQHGGNKAYACERGFGKTQIAIGTVMWAALTGRVMYSLIVGANAEAAKTQRDGIARRLETSDELLAIYPEIAFPMREMAGGVKATASYRGELLRIKYRPDLVFPVVAGAPGSEAVIGCTGIEAGGIRGRYYDRSDGITARPQLIIPDDPQDDEMARNINEVRKRSRKIRQAIQGLAGPGAKISIVMPCTIIAPKDLADEFTDRQLRPEYDGVRVPALQSMPSDLEAKESHWATYDTLRREDLAMGDKTRGRATEYYLAHKRAMARGAVITWPDRVESGAVDALQGLMDKYLADPVAFMSEQQQAPVSEDDAELYLDESGIASRFNGMPRGKVPPSPVEDSELVVVSAIDVQEHILYWCQVAWCPRLTGWIVQRGTHPQQPVEEFHHLRPPRTIAQWLASQFPRQGFTWDDGMDEAIQYLVRSLPTFGGTEDGPIMIDHRWHKSRKVVAAICQRDEFAGVLIPSGGLAVGGNDTRISGRKMAAMSWRPTTDVEWYWKREAGQPRTVLFDANFYRSQLQKGLAEQPGNPGSITYNGRYEDRVLASHLAAKQVRLSVDTKHEVEIWTNKPGRDQDHWLDCAVMCRVGAEVAGLRATGHRHIHRALSVKPITQADVQRRR